MKSAKDIGGFLMRISLRHLCVGHTSLAISGNGMENKQDWSKEYHDVIVLASIPIHILGIRLGKIHRETKTGVILHAKRKCLCLRIPKSKRWGSLDPGKQ